MARHRVLAAALVFALIVASEVPSCNALDACHARALQGEAPVRASLPPPVDAPERHNGIGAIKVFTYGDKSAKGNAYLKAMTRDCSSTATLLTGPNIAPRKWTWHDKLTRLMPTIRSLRNDEIIMLLDGDVTCFPCTRNLTAEFLRHGAGIVVAGYPFYMETSRFKSGWFPPVPLLDSYDDANKTDAATKRNLGYFRYFNVGTMMGYAGAFKYYLSQHYILGGYIDMPKFDDQSTFWANMYLAQAYSPDHPFPPPESHPSALHAHGHGSSRHRRHGISIDAEGSIFQLAMLEFRGRWLRTGAGFLAREALYRKEACTLHLAGKDKRAAGSFMRGWERAKAANATAGAAIAVFGACPTPGPDHGVVWDSPHGSLICGGPKGKGKRKGKSG